MMNLKKMTQRVEMKLILFLLGVLIISVGILIFNEFLLGQPQEEQVLNTQVKNEEVKDVEKAGKDFLKIVDKYIDIEFARTHEERNLGLSGRESIGPDHGLLFVFEETGSHGFWMKDMNFPIDIIWLDENFIVVDIKKEVQPSTFPEIFYPQGIDLYVLEVNSGFSDQYGIEIGSQAELLEDFLL